MAVNVNTVYKTVLLILNKEQRGYLTPDEFNKTATQVQLDIFNSYFETENQQLRIPDNNSEYSDRVKNVQEKISIFQTSGSCSYVGPYFTLPASNTILSDSFQTAAGQQTYILSTIVSSDIDQNLVTVTFDGIVQPDTEWSIFSNVITLTSVPSGVFTVVVNVSSSDFYKLGTVIYNDDKEVQYVQPNEFLELNLSPLTKPTEYFPVYKYKDFKIHVFPKSITSNISCTYVKKPQNPVWNFETPSASNNYQYIYNSTTSVNFDLHPSEQVSIVEKILLYSGVIVNDPTIIQVAAQQIQQEEVNEKS